MADGAVGSTYNFMAPIYNTIIRNIKEGNLKAARTSGHGRRTDPNYHRTNWNDWIENCDAPCRLRLYL